MNFKELFDTVGKQKSFAYQIMPSELEGITLAAFDTPVSVSGEACNRAGIVTLSYSVSVCLAHNCDRCLGRFTREYSYSFRHTVVPYLNGDNDDDEYLIAEGDNIDLNETAISDLLLQLPTKVLCKDDCKGLCSICGTDLNVSECNCNKGN